MRVMNAAVFCLYHVHIVADSFAHATKRLFFFTTGFFSVPGLIGWLHAIRGEPLVSDSVLWQAITQRFRVFIVENNDFRILDDFNFLYFLRILGILGRPVIIAVKGRVSVIVQASVVFLTRERDIFRQFHKIGFLRFKGL